MERGRSDGLAAETAFTYGIALLLVIISLVYFRSFRSELPKFIASFAGILLLSLGWALFCARSGKRMINKNIVSRHLEAKLHNRCAACGNDLFFSEAKYNSESGWPSFYETINEASVDKKEDKKLGMARTEIACGRCGGHLGHVFNDGPKPTGKRYCVNSLALDFKEK